MRRDLRNGMGTGLDYDIKRLLKKEEWVGDADCQRRSNFPQFRRLKIPHLYL